MTWRSRAVLGMIAAAGVCLPMGVFATSASAAPGTNVQIKQNAAIAATTCFTFVGAEDKNYCNYSRPMGDTATVGIPPNTSEVVIDLKTFPWESPADSIALGTEKNRCVEVSGTAFNAKLLEVGC
ncbi:hypothetical protein [Streptomyces inhibens]|uniref:hypothetical protein n=1 Tax=Streptomyces inhibens TaxID=2293571 RepID=UPI001EE75743|nr:hypothetical protein [Streptomyces inhibens]UKY47849.1 hypothetical protein KI385_02735 [Streptomyces inhibens]